MQVPFLESNKDGASDSQSASEPKARRFHAEWLANFGVQYNYSNVYGALIALEKGMFVQCATCISWCPKILIFFLFPHDGLHQKIFGTTTGYGAGTFLLS